jgi:hypothetical protein
MGANTPHLDHEGKKEYLGLHLFNELRWLLCAATEWSIQNKLNLEIEGYDVQVYALDSACLHARTLFEFFVQSTTNNYYGSNEFLGSPLISTPYKNNWKGPLHSFLMHAQDRSHPAPLQSSGAQKNLNRMPVDFAWEILRLWEEFEKKLGESSDAKDHELQLIARDQRKKAIEMASSVMRSSVAKDHAKSTPEILEPIFVFSA